MICFPLIIHGLRTPDISFMINFLQLCTWIAQGWLNIFTTSVGGGAADISKMLHSSQFRILHSFFFLSLNMMYKNRLLCMLSMRLDIWYVLVCVSDIKATLLFCLLFTPKATVLLCFRFTLKSNIARMILTLHMRRIFIVVFWSLLSFISTFILLLFFVFVFFFKILLFLMFYIFYRLQIEIYQIWCCNISLEKINCIF